MGDGAARRRARLSNVPLPEQHVVPLVAAALAESIVRLRLPGPSLLLRLTGVVLLISGAVLGTAAWREARDVLLTDPDRLVTTGPYARWRHPMYRAWALGHLGLALLGRSGWAFALWVPAVLAVRREVEREEESLRQRFGGAHDRYAGEVRR
jgi:protein-S-isoprenylcysteine O-methyltransferase Ste14